MTTQEIQTQAHDYGLTVEKITPTIGAEIEGIDLQKELSEDFVTYLGELLVEHKALFFRDQDITTEQHLAFGRRIHLVATKQANQ